MMQIYNKVILIILFLLSVSSLTAKELALKKISKSVLNEQEQYFRDIYQDSVVIPSLEGILTVGEVMYKTSAPFSLNSDVSWQFLFKMADVPGYQLVNDNPGLRWFHRSKNDQWREIPENRFVFSQPGESEFLVKYQKKQKGFSYMNPLQAQPYCGFSVPLFLQRVKNFPLNIIIESFKGNGNIRLHLDQIDSMLFRKKLVFRFTTTKGNVYHVIEKGPLQDTLTVSTGINSVLTGRDPFPLTISAYSANRKIYECSFYISNRHYAYQSPYFKLNQTPVNLYPVLFLPNFNYLSLFLNPGMQKEIFIKIKSEGYNAIIVPADNINPVLIKNAAETGLALFIDDVNREIFGRMHRQGWLGQNLVHGLIGSDKEHLVNGITQGILFQKMTVHNDTLPLIEKESYAPLLELSFYSPDFIRQLGSFYKRHGGLLINTGFHYNAGDSLLSHADYFKQVINRFKLTSNRPVSAGMFYLTPHRSEYPFAFKDSQDDFFTFRDYLYDSKGFKETASRMFMSFVESPVPLTVHTSEDSDADNNDFLFILVGVLNFFAFTFYFLRLKSFQIYFLRAIKNSHGFFMDLSEKIAVPWSETLFLAIFTGIGVTTSFGSFLSVFNKTLISNNVVNLLLKKPELSTLFFKALDRPIISLIIGFVMYFAYLLAFTFSMRLSFFMFKKRIRLKNCWAIAVWSHVLLAVYILFGLIAYKSILLLHISYEFWIFLAVLLVISYMRLNRGIFITSGIRMYQIYLMSLFFIGILYGIFYFAGYPFEETYAAIREMIQLYH